MISTQVKKIIDQHLQEGQYTACALGIQTYGKNPDYYVVGKSSLDKNAKPVDTKSLFDIASITKVVFTTTLAAVAYEMGKFKLDAKLKTWIPGSEFGEFTIEDLLLHHARFRPGLTFEMAAPNLHKPPNDFESVSKRLMETISKSDISESTNKMVYSDPGFILLAEILSSILKESSEESWQKRLQKPMKLSSTVTGKQIETGQVVVASDMDLARGEIHDPDARYIDKLCGHAGLFSSIEDMMKFASVWIGDYFGEENLLKQDTVRRFIDPYVGKDRALGWDIPSPNSTAGAISKKSIGHLGFTGTSIWIDLEKKRMVTLLTNRVIMGFGKGNEEEFKKRVSAMNAFRREVHQSVWETCFV